MKIAVISDTHNNIENLEKALNRIRKEDIDTIIHCGDFTDSKVAQMLDGFRVIAAFGNVDAATGEIREILLSQNPKNYAGLIYTGELDGVKLAVTHGHLEKELNEMIRSGEYTYVFKGHSHEHCDIMMGSTRLINPGALGGMRRENRQFCVLDLSSGNAAFIEIE